MQLFLPRRHGLFIVAGRVVEPDEDEEEEEEGGGEGYDNGNISRGAPASSASSPGAMTAAAGGGLPPRSLAPSYPDTPASTTGGAAAGGAGAGVAPARGRLVTQASSWGARLASQDSMAWGLLGAATRARHSPAARFVPPVAFEPSLPELSEAVCDVVGGWGWGCGGSQGLGGCGRGLAGSSFP